MTEEKLFKQLQDNNIPFILIGGTALAAFGSSRITIDTDIAVKTLDIDRIISLFYSLNLKMVIGVDKNQYPLFAEDSNEAILFSNKSDWGFIKFLSEDLELDVLYDIPLPFIRLLKNAKTKKVFGIEIKTASLEHLLIMKEKAVQDREDTDKKKLDEIDIAFIKNKLKNNN